MMNLVFLSPHFPPNYYLFCVQLERFGVRVLGIADDPVERLRPELRGALTAYYRVADLHNFKALEEACANFRQRYGKIDRIESHNEHWLETQARLRDSFDIPGRRPAEMVAIKRKSAMKNVFVNAGIPVARGRVVRSREEAMSLIAETGYPVVAKPDIGVGAAQTFKIHDEAELIQFFERKPPMNYIMEEFINGSIYTFDGLVDRQGEVAFCSSLTYSQGVMETVNEGRHIYFYCFRQIEADLEALGRKTLKAFDARETFFHFEYFRKPDGSLLALEVNMRPPGSPILDMCNYSCDIDLYKAWAEIIATGRSTLQYERKYFVCYISRKNRNRYTHSHDEVLQRVGSRLVMHRKVEPIFQAAMGDHAYIVKSPSLDEIHAMAELVQG